jgi:hypothetical protein
MTTEELKERKERKAKTRKEQKKCPQVLGYRNKVA